MRTLALLDERPRDPEELATWVEGLESPDGGFVPVRSPGGGSPPSPTLQYTYWGVETLALLEDDAA